ncbi:SDR family oxidoreductase [Spirillospora sp. NPDC047279]|uniref:SDR family oxidoreductase n=1 Tax=Spirillospora sp. NPDC047279 TaxID=3155478 RepID=UPI0033C9000B
MGTYLITGATGGIGRASAALLHERGHDLILTGRSDDRLTALSKELGGGPRTQVINIQQPVTAPAGAVQTITLDLTEPRRLEAALGETAMPARLDGVVHSAGMVDLGPVAEQDADHWIDQLMVNLVSAAELTRILLPALRAAKGHVVFVNSTAGLQANPNWSAYAASKFGLRALADSLRAEESSLRVTTVYPGRTATDMQQKVRAQEGRPYDPADFVAPTTVARMLVAALEAPRDAVVSEITIRPNR